MYNLQNKLILILSLTVIFRHYSNYNKFILGRMFIAKTPKPNSEVPS